MFVTHRSAEIHLPELFGRQGTQHWRYIEQNLHCAWFYVEIIEPGGGASSMYLLDSATDLEQVMQELRGGFRIEEALLVSTRRMNSLGRWAMEPLLTVSELTDTRDGSVSYSYTVEGGQSYLDSAIATPEQFVKTRTIFSMI
jgi:hypothetical protein